MFKASQSHACFPPSGMFDSQSKPCLLRTSGPRGYFVALFALGIAVTQVGCAGLSPLDYPQPPPVIVPAGHTLHTEPITLPRFLGLDKVCRTVSVVARNGREHVAKYVPALEPHPAAKPLSHPDNAKSPSPAVANVHKLKKQKAQAAVKVKAVAALAQFNCAADPLVEEGLVAALHDPAAEVREAAIEAVLRSTESCTQECGSCCSESIRQILTRMVYEKTDAGCWLEPSSRARRLARLSLDACGGPVADLPCMCEVENTPREYPTETR